ncbi:MAG: putative two-component system sensor kinase [Thermoleophilia bacterium]|nr:putative two-component system sensor kinase [Thermoleophilia bacterium]
MPDTRSPAEAGIELAVVTDIESCCRTVVGWARALSGASAVAVEYAGRLGSHACGDPIEGRPSERVDLVHVDTEPEEWHGHIDVVDPTVEGWRNALELLARQAGVGIGRLHKRDDLARHERQQQALVEAGKALSSERTLEGVLRRIVEHAIELTDARYGALGVIDPVSGELDRFITVGIDEELHARIGELPRGRGILGVLIDDPRPLRLRTLQDHPRSAGFPDHHPPMSSFLGVPIVTSRAVAGRIYLTEKRTADEFSAEDEQLVATLASQAAIAIDNAALNEQLQRTAAELAEASRHKSEFLANMSHELRSPLNTIIGYTRLLLDEPDSLSGEQVEDLEIVRDSSEHLLALIAELLDLQRIEAGRVELSYERVDLRELVDAVLAGVRPSTSAGVELVADCAGLGDPMLECDPVRVRQILLNVMGNAAKFTDSGSITLRAADEDGHVVIDIRDTGSGIDIADQPRIFESFYQSAAAQGRTPGPKEGAGLGLAITRMLTELHGGTASLASEPGVGTTVTIRLPRVRVDAGAGA